MTKHNKKRNVGVIHEQLVRYVGNAIISGDEKAAKDAVGIITKHFKNGSELHREFKLFNALVNIPTGNKEIAVLVINEAKNAAKSHNKAKLTNEKSSLIKDINYQLSEERFYDIRVPHYKLYATVQSLLESWRGSLVLEINQLASYEHSLVEWLSRKEVVQEQKEENYDPLVYRIMLKKFQEKYSKTLLPNQRKIVETALVKGPSSMDKELENARKEALDSLVEFKNNCDNQVLLEKIEKVIDNINNFKTSDNTTNLSRTLQLLELVSELKEKENE